MISFIILFVVFVSTVSTSYVVLKKTKNSHFLKLKKNASSFAVSYTHLTLPTTPYV